MAVEIERKFLVVDDGWRLDVSRIRHIRQGYLSRNGAASVRIRCADGGQAFLTIKSAKQGMVRQEFEYAIPAGDAEEMLLLCGCCTVEKQRHDVPYGGLLWEVDVFLGANAGLVIAEVELASENQEVDRPAWLGEEVTGDLRYYNTELAVRPYRTW